jgi:hypothetical protein
MKYAKEVTVGVVLGITAPVYSSAALADRLQQLKEAAKQCSIAALNAYALATCETSEAIITAAIAKCRPEWNAVEAALEAGMEMDAYEGFKRAVRMGTEVSTGSEAGDKAMIYSKLLNIASDIAENKFRADAATAVFDARVASPNKVCLAPK